MNWTHGAPPLGPLATLLASQQFLLDFTQLLLTSATLFLASEGWNEMLSGFFLTGIQMSWLYGGRRSRVSRLTRVKGNQALSFCEDARYPPKRLLHAGQKTNEKPTCPDRSYSQPRPRGAFALADPPYAGCYLDELCLGAQPRPVSRVKCLKVGPKPSGCAFVSPSSWNNGGWDRPLCRR